MSLPCLRLTFALVGYTEIKSEDGEELSLVWNPDNANIHLKRIGYPDLDFRLDREVEGSLCTIEGNMSGVISFIYLPNRPLTWLEEWGCDFGRGPPTRHTITVLVETETAEEQELYHQFLSWIHDSGGHCRFLVIGSDECTTMLEHHRLGLGDYEDH